MKIDVKSFEHLKDKTQSLFFNTGDCDVFYLKVLYDNCTRMGSTSNSNVTIASVHPDLWFGNFVEKYVDCFKFVSKSPSFETTILGQDNLVEIYAYITQIINFTLDTEFDSFFSKHKILKSLVLFSVNRLFDFRTEKYSWRVQFADLSTKKSIRDAKIDDIIIS